MPVSRNDDVIMELPDTRTSTETNDTTQKQKQNSRKLKGILRSASAQLQASLGFSRSSVSNQFNENTDGIILSLNKALQLYDRNLDEVLEECHDVVPLQEIPEDDVESTPSFHHGMDPTWYPGVCCNGAVSRAVTGNTSDDRRSVRSSSLWNGLDPSTGGRLHGGSINEGYVAGRSRPCRVDMCDVKAMTTPYRQDTGHITGQCNNAYVHELARSTANANAFEVGFKPKRPRHLNPNNRWVGMAVHSEDEAAVDDDWFAADNGNAGRMQTSLSSVISLKPVQGVEGVGQGARTNGLHTRGLDRPALRQLYGDYGAMLETNSSAFVRTFHRAVKLNQLDVVKMLYRIAEGSGYTLHDSVLSETESSATVLHVALINGHEDMVDFLIDKGGPQLIKAPYTHADYKDNTAVHVAVIRGHAELLTRLLTPLTNKEKKALLNSVATGSYFDRQHPDGQLCTTAAVWAGHSHLLETLVKHGANFSVQNTHGDSLLHRIVIMSAEGNKAVDYKTLLDHVYRALKVWVDIGFKRESTVHCSDHVQHQKQQKLIRTFTKLMDIKNDRGVTPLTLAAMTGSPILADLMNLEHVYKIPQTRLGSIAWLSYDVTDVTSYTWNHYNKLSVLHVTGHLSGMHNWGKRTYGDAIHVLDVEPIKSLLKLKWSVYRFVYLAWFLAHIFYMTSFSYLTFGVDSCREWYIAPENHVFTFFNGGGGEDSRVTRHSGARHQPESSGTSSTVLDNLSVTIPPSGGVNGSSVSDHQHGQAKHVTYLLAVLMITPIAYLVTEIIDLFGNRPYVISSMRRLSLFSKFAKRLTAETTLLGNCPHRVVLAIHSVTAVLWFSLYMSGEAHQELMLSLSLLFGWIFVIFFTRGCRYVCRFSVMMQKIFFQDLLYFAIVWLLIMIAFACCLCASFGDRVTLLVFTKMFLRLLNIIIGIAVDVPLDNFQYPVYSYVVIIVYAVFTTILLLNMLIAMMNTSYELVRETKGLLCKQQQLSIMMMLERRLVWCKWLCRLSEQKIWYKESQGDIRAYLDVTTPDTAAFG